MNIQEIVEVNGSFYPHTRKMTPEEEQAYVASRTPSVEEQIKVLKQILSDSDYKAIKYAEGWISEEDYAPIKNERQAIRDKINLLQNEIQALTQEGEN